MAHPGGRPTKLTPKMRKNLAKLIELGATYEDACAYVGIHYSTFRNWMRQGQRESEAGNAAGQFLQFFKAIKRAEGALVVRLMAEIEDAATAGNWKAAAWKLERRYPERYGRQVQQHQLRGQVKLEPGDLTQSILGNPAASKAASKLVAELAGIGQNQDDPGWDSLEDKPGSATISPAPEAGLTT